MPDSETEIIIRSGKTAQQAQTEAKFGQNQSVMANASQALLPHEQGAKEVNESQEAVNTVKAMQSILTSQAMQSPSDYVFNFSPETMVDKALVEDFQRFAFEQKMSLENARLMAKFYEKYVQEESKKQSQKQQELLQELTKSCETDTEFGGTSFYENMRYAKAAMLRFDDGSLAKILSETGFGSHPEVVRFMYRVGKALSEKDMAVAKEKSTEQSVAELFYPSMKK